jgi:RNA polymerase sigma factor (sigma-70 family)
VKSADAHIPDQDLLNRYYHDGDNEWLGILLQRYTLLLFGVCMKYLKNEEEAKDAVQQVFEKTIRELAKYKVDYFKSWIYMVAKNHCLMKLRDKGKITKEITEQLLSTPAEEHHIPDKEKQELLLQNLGNALPLISHEQRTCIELFYLHKQSYQQIAAQTGYSILQVKSYIQNGKRNLRMLLQKQNSHE